jgi:hypothetical protein
MSPDTRSEFLFKTWEWVMDPLSNPTGALKRAILQSIVQQSGALSQPPEVTQSLSVRL